eukprot:4151892-Prymnesium_polylepis.1
MMLRLWPALPPRPGMHLPENRWIPTDVMRRDFPIVLAGLRWRARPSLKRRLVELCSISGWAKMG